MLESEGVAELGEFGMVLSVFRIARIVTPGDGNARVGRVPYSRREGRKGADSKRDVLLAFEAVDREDKVCRVCRGEVFFVFCIRSQQQEVSLWWVGVYTRIYDPRCGSYAGEGLCKDCTCEIRVYKERVCFGRCVAFDKVERESVDAFDYTCALGKELVREMAVKEDFRLRVKKA